MASRLGQHLRAVVDKFHMRFDAVLHGYPEVQNALAALEQAIEEHCPQWHGCPRWPGGRHRPARSPAFKLAALKAKLKWARRARRKA